MIALLRANPGLLVAVVLAAMMTLVLSAVAVLMSRSGASLRPVVFLAVLFGLVVIPQVAFQLATATGVLPKRDLTWIPARDAARLYGFREHEDVLAAEGGAFLDPSAVFGADHDASLVADIRAPGSGSPFSSAQVAQMAVLPPTGSMIVARYASASEASVGADAFVTSTAGSAVAPGKDGTRTYRRAAGDMAKVVVAGRTVIVITGPDEATLASRLGSSRVVAANRSNRSTPRDPDAFTSRDLWLYRPGVLPLLGVALILVYVVWFFKGAAWAGSVPAVSGVEPQPASELRQRLLAINQLDVPFTVREDALVRRLTISWRYADARWLDLARLQGLRNTHRIILQLDEASHVARPTEQATRFEWAVGRSGGDVRWATSRGITFFQIDHQRVYGLQFDERGRVIPALSYSYHFNLQEMKAPLIAAVTRAGWTWRPTVWQGPSWLRWLTN